MDALAMLVQDHERMKKMLHKLEEMGHKREGERERLFREIDRELTAHEDLEEHIIYPAFKREAELKDIGLERYREHHVADVLRGEMRCLSASEEVWDAKLKVLREELEHHIEEEEGDMFKKARKFFSHEALERMGREMALRRREYEGKLAA